MPTIQSLLGNSKKYREMKAATLDLSNPDATKRIIEEIFALLPAHTQVKNETLSAVVV